MTNISSSNNAIFQSFARALSAASQSQNSSQLNAQSLGMGYKQNNGNYGNGNAYGARWNNSAVLFPMMMSMMQQMLSLVGNYFDRGNSYPPVSNYPTYPSTPSYPTQPPCNHYPTPTPTPTPYPTPTPTPYPPVEDSKIRGAAGLVGDPKFMLLTPSLQNDPKYAALKSFDSAIKNGQTATLLNDADQGGFQVNVTGIQVDPAKTNSTGVGQANFKVGNQTVAFSNNGDLLVDGVKKGNINDTGFIGTITLANGATVSTANRVDDANGNQKERFIIRNGEYEVTAAVRSPHPDSKKYLDMNFEELTNNAATNATGYQTNVAGFGNIGIVDLLKLEA